MHAYLQLSYFDEEQRETDILQLMKKKKNASISLTNFKTLLNCKLDFCSHENVILCRTLLIEQKILLLNWIFSLSVMCGVRL